MFVLTQTVQQRTGGLNPRKVFYEVQKARLRLVQLLEAIEGITGARPGARLPVNFRGTALLGRQAN